MTPYDTQIHSMQTAQYRGWRDDTSGGFYMVLRTILRVVWTAEKGKDLENAGRRDGNGV